MKNYPACKELLVYMDSRNLHLNMEIENHKVTSGCLKAKFMDMSRDMRFPTMWYV